LSAAFVAAMTKLAGLSERRCSEPWEWPGHSGWPLQVRDALYRSLEEELAAVAAQAAPTSEAGRLLTVGQRAWGELRGLLVGIPDTALDQAPPSLPAPADEQESEWTLREVLAHVLLTERRYRQQVQYALRRSESEPLARPPSAALSESERSGDLSGWIQKLAAERMASAELASATADQLQRPTVWAGYHVNVRFRMLRFAGHLVEHAVQAEKVLAARGWEAGEAHQIVRRISAARGAHELSTHVEILGRLDAVHSERAARLAAPG
jgi:uncharacterized damage-inducible protein DinB